MPTNTYDPTAAQPYQAYQPPEPAAPPPPVPQSQPFQFTGAPISKAGAAAGLIDNIFKGYMNGKADAAQKVAGQFKAKSDNLRASYEQDAQRLDGLARSGAKPGDAEYDTAVSAVMGSYGAMMEWQDKVVNGPDGNKPKKSKKASPAVPPANTGQPPTPAQQIQQLFKQLQTPGMDKQEQAQILHKINVLKGPPVLWQIKQYQTPEYQAQRQTAQLGGQHELSTAQAQGVVDKLGQQYAELRSKPKDQQTPAEQKVVADYEQAYNVVNPPKPSRSTGKVEWLTGENGEKKPFELQDGKYVPVEAPEGFQPQTKPPTASELKRQDYDDARKKGYKGSFEEWTAEESTRGHRAADGGRGSGGGGGGEPMFSNTPEGKKSLQVYNDLSKRYTNLSQAERKELADKAASSPKDAEDMAARASSYLSSDEKAKEYESAVLEHAMSVVRSNFKDAVNQDGDKVDIDKALSNIVGHNGKYLQYGSPKYAPKKLFGNAGQGQVKDMENALQDEIETMMKSKQFALPSTLADEIQGGRFHPFIGDSSAPEPVNVREKRSTVTPGSPQAGAPSAAPASSPASQGGQFVTQSLQGKSVPGMVSQGNLDITKRPNIDNHDGTHSSTFSYSFGTDKGETLVPGVGDGTTYPRRKLSSAEALDQFKKTGKNFGAFKDVHSANAYARILHLDQEKYGNSSSGKSDMIQMRLPDGRVGPIHQSQKDQFIKDHPGATEVKGAAR